MNIDACHACTSRAHHVAPCVRKHACTETTVNEAWQFRVLPAGCPTALNTVQPFLPQATMPLSPVSLQLPCASWRLPGSTVQYNPPVVVPVDLEPPKGHHQAGGGLHGRAANKGGRHILCISQARTSWQCRCRGCELGVKRPIAGTPRGLEHGSLCCAQVRRRQSDSLSLAPVRTNSTGLQPA